MKVYVDELPKRCLGCCLLSDGNFCNHDDFVGELHSVNVYKEKPKNCPLQSITDYTKQVRKEVVQEITELAKNQFEFLICDECYNTIDKDVYISSIALTEILDQIQGETKWEN